MPAPINPPPGNPPQGADDYTQNEKDNENKLLELAEKRYDYELQRSKDLDSKAGNLIGYVGIVTSLIIGLGTFDLVGRLSTTLYYVLYFGGITALAASIFFSVWAIKVRKFTYKPSQAEIKYFYERPSTPFRILLRINIEGMTKASGNNWQVNNSKAIWILISLICFIAGIILLLSYAGVYTYEHGISTSTGDRNATRVVSELDNATFKELILGSNISFNPRDILKERHTPYPNTTSSWMAIRYQWLKDNLTTYVVINSSSKKEKQEIASGAINEWLKLLRTQSHNSSAWNVNIRYVEVGYLTVHQNDRPDIVLLLYDDPSGKQCSKYYGKAEQLHEDYDPQYAKIFTMCGNRQLTPANLYTIILHEFAHTLGLGHAHTQSNDLLCGVDNDRRTCPSLPSLDSSPSKLDLNALLSIYGNDGFGGYNRVSVSKSYYICGC
jgi:Matrixin